MRLFIATLFPLILPAYFELEQRMPSEINERMGRSDRVPQTDQLASCWLLTT
jgi:hypothetical protein